MPARISRSAMRLLMSRPRLLRRRLLRLRRTRRRLRLQRSRPSRVDLILLEADIAALPRCPLSTFWVLAVLGSRS